MALIVLLMVVLEATVGTSQVPMLTRSSSNVDTCPNESIEFSCTITSTLVQWIAEPFIDTSVGSRVVFNSAAPPLLPTLIPDSSNVLIRVIQISASPFVTALTISGNVNRMITAVCIDLVNGVNSTEKYISGEVSLQNATCSTPVIVSTNISAGMAEVGVQCQPSVSPEVTHRLNYPGGSMVFDGTNTTIVVSCDVGSLDLRVCVSNRCGRETCGETEMITVTCPDSPTTPSSIEFSSECPPCEWCYGVLGGVSFLSVGGGTVVMVVAVGYVKYFKKEEDEKGEGSIPLEVTGNDVVNKA